MLDPGAADESPAHLAILIGLAPEASVADRETLFFSVRGFIEAVARDRPTLLVFEDLHWADSSLLDLVELLAARLRDLPSCSSFSPGPSCSTRGRAGAAGLPAYTALSARAALRGGRAPARSRTCSCARCRPRAQRRRARAGRRRATRCSSSSSPPRWRSASRREHSSLPTTIRSIVAARLDALPAGERALVLDAAVGGKVFWRGALERNGSPSRRRSPTSLAALERRDLIRRETVSAIEGEQQFTFKHVLIRDVAYDLLPRARRRERHEQLRAFLEEATAEVGEAGAALARHWREAGDPERALEYLVAAAEQAGAWLGEGPRRRRSIARRSSSSRKSDEERREGDHGAAGGRAPGTSSTCRTRSCSVLSGPEASSAGEVGGRDVAGDLVNRVDRVLAELLPRARGRSSSSGAS